MSISNYPNLDKLTLTFEREGLRGRKYYNGVLENEVQKKHYLKLIYIRDYETSELIIRGNLCKWYFKTPNSKTLTLEQFSDCMELLFSKIGIKKEQLLNCSSKTRVSKSLFDFYLTLNK